MGAQVPYTRPRVRAARGIQGALLGVGLGAGLGAFAWPTPARAGGFEVPDAGTVGIGRGGAFTARADNLSAFHYNPAGLAKQSGPHFLLVGNVVHLRNRFTRRGSGGMVQVPWNDPDRTVLDPEQDVNTGEPYASVQNGRRFGPSPMFVASWGDVGVDGLSLQLGLAPPVSFGNHDWPEDGAQRYTITQGEFRFLIYGAGLSYRFDRWLMVGANFLVGSLTADFTTRTRSGSTGANDNEDLEGDARSTVSIKDRFVPSANFGVLSQPLDFLELGVSARLPFRTKASGSLAYVPGEVTPDAQLASDARVELQQTFPLVLRTGVRFIHRRFDVELDYVFENYDKVERIDVAFSNPDEDVNPAELTGVDTFDDPSLLYLDTFGNQTAFTPLIATPAALLFRNTHSLRLGSDVELLPKRLTVRAGGFWASRAYDADHSTYTIRFPYSDQLGIGCGLTWHAVPELDVSLGYLHIFQPDVEVTEGVVQANAFRNPGDPSIDGNIVNNGLYETSLDIFGVSLQVNPLARRTVKRAGRKSSP